MQHDHNSNTNIAQGLMEFALATSKAAEELARNPTGQGDVSATTQRIVRIWRAGEQQGAYGGYAHPSAAAIAADSETEVFALITAVRAARDAIEQSNLSPEQRARAAVMLAHQLAPADSAPAFIAAEIHKLYKMLPYDTVMRLAGKALVMGATAAHGPLRPEMVDFIRHAERHFSSSNFAPPALGFDLAADEAQTDVAGGR